MINRLVCLSVLYTSPALTHDPVFGLGPHVLFKGGIEIAPQVISAKEEDNRETETSVELTYGLTGDWAAGVELPYVDKNGINDNSGFGDIRLFTKYRFWSGICSCCTKRFGDLKVKRLTRYALSALMTMTASMTAWA